MTDAEWLVEFRSMFPEYAAASDTLVLSRLPLALVQTPSNIWGSLYKYGVLYLWAHLLAMVPGSENMRLGDGSTGLYKKERDAMAQAVSSGYRVASTLAKP